VKIIPALSAICDTSSRSLCQILNGNNSATDFSLELKFGTKFGHSTASILQMSNIKGQMSRSQCHRSRSQPNVTYQHENRYKTATDRLSDFKIGIGVIIKGDKDWCGVGRHHVTMHHNCHVF